jgi:hypothetical protein
VSKESNFNWTTTKGKNLEKAIAHFNHRIDLHNRDFPEEAKAMPDRKTIESVTEAIANQKDYDKQMRSLEKIDNMFSLTILKGTEKLQTTRYQMNEEISEWKMFNKDLARRVVEAEFDKKKGTEGSVQKNLNLQPRKDPREVFNETKKPSQWQSYIHSNEKKTRSTYTAESMKRYKDNYLQAIRGQLVEGSSHLRGLYDLISSMTPEFVVKNFTGDADMGIDFIYETEIHGEDTVEDRAMEYWEDAIGEAEVKGLEWSLESPEEEEEEE